MKAQVLHEYDESLTASNWVTYEDVPDPKITKPTDVRPLGISFLSGEFQGEIFIRRMVYRLPNNLRLTC